MKAPGFLIPAIGVAMACALALAPATLPGQGAGPPPAPSVSGETAAGRSGVADGSGPAAVQDASSSLAFAGEAVADQETPAAANNEAASSAAGQSGRQGGADRAAADRSGRQVPPPPAAPASPPEWFWRDAEIARAFECPIGPIATLLEAAQGESEFSPALAVERQVLSLCRDRWTVLKELMDAELSLASVVRANAAAEAETDLRLAAAREREAIALEERRRVARARIEGARQGAIEAAREAQAREEAVATAAAVPEEEAPKPEPGPAPEEVYGWFALKGSGTDLRAGVTDGRGRWWVGVGDELPGGVRIGSIRARPPRVAVKGGAAAGLPYRAVGR